METSCRPLANVCNSHFERGKFRCSSEDQSFHLRKKKHIKRPASGICKPMVKIKDAGQKGERAEFAETRSAFAVLKCSRRQYRHEGNMRIASRKGVINVITDVERRARIAPAKNFQQAIGMWFFSLNVVHCDDASKMPRGGPTVKRIRKFPPCTASKKIQLETPRPALDLPRRNHQFFLADIAALAVFAPIKLLECLPSLPIGCRPPERGGPIRHHVPIIVVTRFAFPFVQLGPCHSLAS